MMKKTFRALQNLSGSIMTAGLIILLIGAYYTIIKAGIPYQDAPDDILWVYQINMHIGEVLEKDGAIILTAGFVFLFIVRAVRKNSNPEKQKPDHNNPSKIYPIILEAFERADADRSVLYSVIFCSA